MTRARDAAAIAGMMLTSFTGAWGAFEGMAILLAGGRQMLGWVLLLTGISVPLVACAGALSRSWALGHRTVALGILLALPAGGVLGATWRLTRMLGDFGAL